jgi:Sec-independent protein translocase protein TatA
MNVFGIGPTELGIILLIMLIVAGPKRMARWAYVMGIYIGKMRDMWQETSTVIKKELAEAGIEPEVLDSLGKAANPRTRRTAFSGQLDRLVDDMKKPISDAIKDVGTTSIEEPPPAPQAADNETDAGSEETVSTGEEQPDSSGRYDAWTPS